MGHFLMNGLLITDYSFNLKMYVLVFVSPPTFREEQDPIFH